MSGGAAWSLASFQGSGYDKGRSWAVQAAWFAVSNLFFMAWWLPRGLRAPLLRLFGADVGKDVFIRHRVRILWPWKLSIGDHSWIGEDVWLLNLEPIAIAHDVCLSQGAFLCTGSHDSRSASFEYDNAPIKISPHVWVAAQALVLRGVTIGAQSVIGTRAIVGHDVPPESSITAGDRW